MMKYVIVQIIVLIHFNLFFSLFYSEYTLSASKGTANSQLWINQEIPDRFEAWIRAEKNRATAGILQNISPPGAKPGAIVASPSRSNPNYYFHWVRDAALTVGAMLDLYDISTSNEERNLYDSILHNYINFSKLNQNTPNRSGGLGEPKFNPDGSPFDEEWGRPQNDGPALRAIVLIRYAKTLLAKPENEVWVRKHLYDCNFPTSTVIKADLEFISNNWKSGSFDLWEEVQGHHFYTRIVQRRALLDGAELADQLGDFGASNWYFTQARALEKEIDRHWDESHNYLIATIGQSAGITHKKSGLDVAIILGVNHSYRGDNFYSPLNDKVLSTAFSMYSVFEQIYEINHNTSLAPAIGRYPEDHYDGYSTDMHPGNPWVLSTFAFAEFYYRVAKEMSIEGKVTITQRNFRFFEKLVQSQLNLTDIHVGDVYFEKDKNFILIQTKLMNTGDNFLKRIKYHIPEDGSLSEQINRYTGFMQGARDLTWSYASAVTSILERMQLASNTRSKKD